MTKVAIIVPAYKKKLGSDELASLRHLKRYLSKYDKFFVVPDNIDQVEYKSSNFKYIRFPAKYFSSRQSYNNLLLQDSFYHEFLKYDYILIYQLDALVFSDELLEWCKKGYDYIAAPWFGSLTGRLTHKKGSPPSGGNGGFSLRKVRSAMKVLEVVNSQNNKNFRRSLEKLSFLRSIFLGKTHGRWLKGPADNYPFNEDGFWSLEAPKYLEGYKVAPFAEALSFGFERFPEKSYKLNGNKLPFGAHAWRKNDLKFWKKYILRK